MYRNLVAELARRGITRGFIADQINLSPSTFGKKIKGDSAFTLEQAEKILSILNDGDTNLTFEYLFQKS